jgi:hypothetical protein
MEVLHGVVEKRFFRAACHAAALQNLPPEEQARQLECPAKSSSSARKVLNGPSSSRAGPAYAEIIDDSEPDRVQVRLLPLGTLTGMPRREYAGTCLWVHCSRANQCRVWEGELTAGALGSLLRRPIFAMIDDRPCYGQVTAYDGATVTIWHGADEAEAPVADVEEVAPIIVFLLSKAKLVRRLLSRAAIDQTHAMILDRLLSTSTRSDTREIRRLLTGIATLATHPSPTAELTWMDPRTSQNGTCRVRHVVDFGFYTDGNQVIPTGTILGSHFSIDPHAAELATGSLRQPLQEAVPATASQDSQGSQDERLAISSGSPCRPGHVLWRQLTMRGLWTSWML